MPNTQEKIDTSLSPAIDDSLFNVPAVADFFTIGANDDGPVRHAAWTLAKSTMSSVLGIAAKMSEAERAIKQLGAAPDAATDTRLRRGARSMMTQARKAFDDAYKSLAEHATALDNEATGIIGTEQSKNGVCENARGAEIRQWLRTLKPMDRDTALQQAMRDGDREIVAACLAAPAALSGHDRSSLTNLRFMAREKLAPDQNRIIEGIDKAAELLRTADTALARRFEKLSAEGQGKFAAVERSLAAMEGGS